MEGKIVDINDKAKISDHGLSNNTKLTEKNREQAHPKQEKYLFRLLGVIAAYFSGYILWRTFKKNDTNNKNKKYNNNLLTFIVIVYMVLIFLCLINNTIAIISVILFVISVIISIIKFAIVY